MLIELNQDIMEGLSKTEREIVVFINENEEPDGKRGGQKYAEYGRDFKQIPD